MTSERAAAFEQLKQFPQRSPIDVGIAFLAVAVFFGLILLVGACVFNTALVDDVGAVRHPN